MTITLNGTTGITTDTGYSGDGVTFADGTPSNTLVTTTGGNVGIGTSSPALGFVVEKDNGSGYVAGFRSAPGSPILTIQNTGGISQIQGLNSALSATANIALQVSGGNVGIGTSSPSSALQVSRSGAVSVTVSSTGGGGNWEFGADASGNGYIYSGQSKYLALSTSGSERMRIDSSGNLLVGRTNRLGSEKFVVGNSNNGWNSAFVQDYNVANQTNLFLFHSFASGANSGTQITFSNSTGTTVGTIASTGSATSYNTSSDYRLKENIAPMQNALGVVQQLKPVTYTWKADGSSGQGFIAHELQEVVPDCVTGEKDAVDADGNPVYQGIDTSFLVATLTAAIQEQQAIITEQSLAMQDLKARIETLENK